MKSKLMRTTAVARLLAAAAAGSTAGSASATDLSVPYQVPPTMSALPAVSGVNGKFDIFGGGYNGNGVGGVAGSSSGGLGGIGGTLSIPLGFRFGNQLDGTIASVGGKFYGTVADHLFVRDPNVGLIGLYGKFSSNNNFGGVRTGQAGIEGEYYLPKVTLRGVVGGEGGSSNTFISNGFFEKVDVSTRFFDKIDVAFYPTPDWEMFVGHRYVGGINAGAAGVEYLWRVSAAGAPAISTYVEGRAGEDNYRAVWAGLRIYFGGGEKSLIDRKRQDDPPDWELDPNSVQVKKTGVVPTTPTAAKPPPSSGCPAGYYSEFNGETYICVPVPT